jgi:protein gp37
MENSKIEWCHHTFNPWMGCQHVSQAVIAATPSP